MKCNTYLEEFKIDIVKQYLSGKQQKDLHAEYGLSKSTIYTWTCKYRQLVEKEWEIKDVHIVNQEYIDITVPFKKENKEQTYIKTSNETVRIFKNGYSIICHISKLDKVLKVIEND